MDAISHLVEDAGTTGSSLSRAERLCLMMGKRRLADLKMGGVKCEAAAAGLHWCWAGCLKCPAGHLWHVFLLGS